MDLSTAFSQSKLFMLRSPVFDIGLHVGGVTQALEAVLQIADDQAAATVVTTIATAHKQSKANDTNKSGE